MTEQLDASAVPLRLATPTPAGVYVKLSRLLESAARLADDGRAAALDGGTHVGPEALEWMAARDCLRAASVEALVPRTGPQYVVVEVQAEGYRRRRLAIEPGVPHEVTLTAVDRPAGVAVPLDLPLTVSATVQP